MFLRDFWIKLDNVNEKAMEMERKYNILKTQLFLFI